MCVSELGKELGQLLNIAYVVVGIKSINCS